MISKQMTTSQQLNQRFACEGAHFEDGNGGLVRAVIETPAVQGEVYLHGAHITRFQPAGHAPILFLSEKSHFAPDKPIRGGVPLCFPWFGPRDGDESAPMHGLARLLAWEVENVEKRGDAVEIVLVLAPTGKPHPAWPNCELRYEISFGASLQMRLAVKNSGENRFVSPKRCTLIFKWAMCGKLSSKAYRTRFTLIKPMIFKKKRSWKAS